MKLQTLSQPIEFTVKILGSKWKPVILWNLRDKPHRFSSLIRLTTGISQRMLTQELRFLEANGIIKRTFFSEIPPRVEYELTMYGRTLLPILNLMHQWGTDKLPPRTGNSFPLNRKSTLIYVNKAKQ